jgi:hypothetical protein
MSINVNRQGLQSNIAIEQNKTQKQNNTSASGNVQATNSHEDSVELTSQAVN